MIPNYLKKSIASFMALVFVIGGTVNVFALSNGSYTVLTQTSYLNPDTGKTDDGGTGNIELGEGMCRSAVYETAFIEQNASQTYITLRMLLYSNISNIRIAVQDSPKGSYSDTNYTIEKESPSSDSADLKFKVPSAECYIQIKMYVGPMGRDVCFYVHMDTASALQSGSFTEAPSAAKDQGQFVDISSHWAKNAIHTVVDLGLFSGTSEITFSPDQTMTRGMFVTVLGRLSGDNMSSYSESKFSDVPAEAYYANYVNWASEKGLVSGTSGTKFSPDEPVTCEQMAVIMVKFAQYKNANLVTKSISPSTSTVSSWAKDAVVTAGRAGLITKQNTNGYDYTSSATRAGVASVIANYIEYYR